MAQAEEDLEAAGRLFIAYRLQLSVETEAANTAETPAEPTPLELAEQALATIKQVCELYDRMYAVAGALSRETSDALKESLLNGTEEEQNAAYWRDQCVLIAGDEANVGRGQIVRMEGTAEDIVRKLREYSA
jgi:hydrogenase maturation factor HypF (carbamoyltransferase family)